MTTIELKPILLSKLKTKRFKWAFFEFIERGTGVLQVDNNVTLTCVESNNINGDVITVFTTGDDLFEIKGYYDSFSGYNYDDTLETLCKVQPVQKTITIFERVEEK